MLETEETSFDALLDGIRDGLRQVQECVQKLGKYGNEESPSSPLRLSRSFRKECAEQPPGPGADDEKGKAVNLKGGFALEEMEAPVAGERKPEFVRDLRRSKSSIDDWGAATKTLGLGLPREKSQAFLPRETWMLEDEGDRDVFQDFLEDCAEKYAQKPDLQSRPQLVVPTGGTADLNEKRRCMCSRCCRVRLMLHPQSRRRLIWDSVSVFMISVDMIMLPMIYGMNISEYLEVLVVEWICTIFWSVDMAITFMTGYTVGPDVIMSPRKVALHYLTTWFAVDFAIVGSEWASRITEFVAGFNAFRAARAVRVLRVVRVVRLIRLARFVKTLQKFTEMTGSLRLLIFNVLKLTSFLLLAVHIFSCGWHFVGLYTEGGWIEKEGYTNETVVVRYVAAARWTFAQLNGRTDRQDRTFTEMLFVAFTACFTLIFMSIFVSSLTSRMLQLQQLMDKESGYKRLLQRYNEMHSLQYGTVYLAKRHIQDRMTLEDDMDTEKELLRLLPIQTQADLLSEVRFPLLSHHPLFRVVHYEFQTTVRSLLITAIRQEPTRHMETIFAKGGVGHQMYFVEGRWLLYSKDTSLKDWLKGAGMDFEIQTRSSPTRRLHTLVTGRRHFMQSQKGARIQDVELPLGTYLCEASLWVEKWHHQGDFVSMGHSKLVIVNSDAFAEAVAKHEDSSRIISHYARRYVTMLKTFAEAGQPLGDVVESDLYMLLGVEKPDTTTSGTSSSSINGVWKTGIDLRQVVLRASPFLRGNSASSSSFVDWSRGRSNSSVVEVPASPMRGQSLQAKLATIQSEGDVKERPVEEAIEETKVSL